MIEFIENFAQLPELSEMVIEGIDYYGVSQTYNEILEIIFN